MLQAVHIVGFKSISEISLDLGQINVFVGANGSGKSNLLEAIGVLGAAASGTVEPESLRYRGVRPGLPTIYKSSFRDQHLRRIITLEASSKNGNFRVGLDNPIGSRDSKWRISWETFDVLVGNEWRPVVGRSPRGIRLSLPDNTRDDLPESTITDQMTLLRSQLLRWAEVPNANLLIEDLTNFAIFSPTTPVLRGLSTEDISREPVGLSGSALPQAFRTVARDRGISATLQEFTGLIDWARYVSVSPSEALPISPSVSTSNLSFRFVDRYMRAHRNVLSGYDASEGALYIIFLAVLALHPKSPRVYAIDNFDQALHPRLVRELTERFCDVVLQKPDSQVFISTHNPLALDGLDLTDDRIRLFGVDRDKQGTTMIRRIDVSRIKGTNLGDQQSLSQLWVMGRLGAVPKLF